ncbi:hypothetical protein PGT21_033625 [Puccinia graminis f. sp. tritici]|uniref:Peptidase S54 rhomboid domain-containing protein n=2 Tax=Puccinia graminis f. sp. tritici TaxID=56615 RepID=E3KIL2_PUCGT|nr:uncharacterized protein PGTG_10515 [Puccinia graminis f. sp. tritici CRL 75-36-700-3]EFP84137.2 hypothetical protein PGTG_10515 [Puccinia graminis f. sp. tritici CRL 75-36-700-3]KAA1072952.1 hypothetical protein PGTUg99_007339 [Puccinia graminis f. sp. tritici]KAA1084655.1 hypothetical protein PGT21_033625 [Puccinia graminis f. sp. tritici]
MGASSTFAHAPLSRIIIFGTSILSLLLSGHKHYLDLPLTPHLTRDFQFWRILTHHTACSNSADLFLIVLILWNVSVTVERRFGTVKYASYLIVTVVVGSLLELMGLLISHSIMGYRAIPSGPFMVTFAIVYQHHAIVPSLYDYRIGRVHLDSHSLVPDILSLLLGLFNPLSSLVGILVGALYRTDQLGLARWRLRNSFLLSRLTSRSSDRRRKPRPTHASLEDDPRFEATIAPSRSSL